MSVCRRSSAKLLACFIVQPHMRSAFARRREAVGGLRGELKDLVAIEFITLASRVLSVVETRSILWFFSFLSQFFFFYLTR